jgi:hypothetical protein
MEEREDRRGEDSTLRRPVLAGADKLVAIGTDWCTAARVEEYNFRSGRLHLVLDQ